MAGPARAFGGWELDPLGLGEHRRSGLPLPATGSRQLLPGASRAVQDLRARLGLLLPSTCAWFRVDPIAWSQGELWPPRHERAAAIDTTPSDRSRAFCSDPPVSLGICDRLEAIARP